jgi:hypothetical protein
MAVDVQLVYISQTQGFMLIVSTTSGLSFLFSVCNTAVLSPACYAPPYPKQFDTLSLVINFTLVAQFIRYFELEANNC